MTAPGVYFPSTPNTLAARTSEAIGRNPDRRTGVVVSFAAGILTVSVAGGEPRQVGYLASYVNPQPGDVVALELQRSTWLCLGRIYGEADPATDELPYMQSGQVTLSATSATNVSLNVLFPVPFNTPNIAVHVNINGASGGVGFWHVKAITISATGFTLFGFRQSGLAATTFSEPVGWTAVKHGVYTRPGG